MKNDYDLWITNCLTNDVFVVHDFSDYAYNGDFDLTSKALFVHIKPYLDKQIPFKLEFVYKSWENPFEKG